MTKKNQQNQDKPDPSGRFVGPFRATVTTGCFGIDRVIELQLHMAGDDQLLWY
ncbi:hypothetical protein GO621_12655 [Mucilaginibacter sp. HMF7410]|uniref:Uncharacterized protein n=1 Tax=Mucilaginibacter arboris TaxID=2682090 RepID=A0A7K1SYI3_9SPHI|nr:hypothetical protein [Mucilaginibacter arboris]